MQIEWKSDKTSPYLFRQAGEWPGIRIHRARVEPGRLLEHTNTSHEVNVAISGRLITEKISATGRHITTHGTSQNICVTPAGQALRAEWNKQLDNMGILVDPEYLNRAAVENGLPDGFEFREVYQQHDPLIQHLGLALLDEADSAGTGWTHVLRFADPNFDATSSYQLRDVEADKAYGQRRACPGTSSDALRNLFENTWTQISVWSTWRPSPISVSFTSRAHFVSRPA
jgi:hypothetical protein